MYNRHRVQNAYGYVLLEDLAKVSLWSSCHILTRLNQSLFVYIALHIYYMLTDLNLWPTVSELKSGLYMLTCTLHGCMYLHVLAALHACMLYIECMI